MQEERQEERQAKMRETWEVKRHGLVGSDKKGEKRERREADRDRERETGGRDRKTQSWGKAKVITQ